MTVVANKSSCAVLSLETDTILDREFGKFKACLVLAILAFLWIDTRQAVAAVAIAAATSALGLACCRLLTLEELFLLVSDLLDALHISAAFDLVAVATFNGLQAIT